MTAAINGFWQIFLAALLANAVTSIVIYTLVLKHRDSPIGEVAVRSAAAAWKMAAGFVKAYIFLIVAGAIAYAAYLIATEGFH